MRAAQGKLEQAKVAAATVCGKDKEIAALPWFWSDQYDLKLKIAGLNTGYDDIDALGGKQTASVGGRHERVADGFECAAARLVQHAPDAVRIGLDADDLVVAGLDRCRVADGLP